MSYCLGQCFNEHREAFQPMSKRFFKRTIGCLLGLWVLMMGIGPLTFCANAESYFPPKTLVSLTGKKRSFFHPKGHKSKNNRYVFIALGFHPKKQAELERGVTLASQVAASHPNLDVVEIAVLPQKYESSSGVIQNFMKATVQNKQNLAHVYPLFDDVKALKNTLGLNTANDMVFLLCNPQGEIVWKSPEKTKPEWTALWASKLADQ
jgi:hypothetical protein